MPFTGTSPNWKYFQNGARRLSACALAIVGIYNVSTTNTLSILIQRTILYYLSSFQRKISLGGQLIWWIWTSIARLLPSIDRVDQSMVTWGPSPSAGRTLFSSEETDSKSWLCTSFHHSWINYSTSVNIQSVHCNYILWTILNKLSASYLFVNLMWPYYQARLPD